MTHLVKFNTLLLVLVASSGVTPSPLSHQRDLHFRRNWVNVTALAYANVLPCE